MEFLEATINDNELALLIVSDKFYQFKNAGDFIDAMATKLNEFLKSGQICQYDLDSTYAAVRKCLTTSISCYQNGFIKGLFMKSRCKLGVVPFQSNEEYGSLSFGHGEHWIKFHEYKLVDSVKDDVTDRTGPFVCHGQMEFLIRISSLPDDQLVNNQVFAMVTSTETALPYDKRADKSYYDFNRKNTTKTRFVPAHYICSTRIALGKYKLQGELSLRKCHFLELDPNRLFIEYDNLDGSDNHNIPCFTSDHDD